MFLDSFLEHMRRTFALECPTGRGSDEYAPVIFLPSDQTHGDVFNELFDAFSKLTDASGEWLDKPESFEPLTFSAFLRWGEDHPNLRVAKKRSDFCDL